MAMIRINDLTVHTIIGTQPYERANKQELIINLALEYDARKASTSDAITDALDYYKLSRKVTQVVERSKHHLLEKLAARVLKVMMADPRVERAWVRLDKPHAFAAAKTISFELSAEKGEKF